MIDNLTKFLEKVDQRAGETIGQRVESPAILSFPPSEPSPLPERIDRPVEEHLMVKRDQTLLRLQRDYDELAVRTKEVAGALEQRTAEVDELKTIRTDLLRDLDRAREQLRKRESADSTYREEVDGLQSALHDALSATESARQEIEIISAQKRQWESQSKANADELLDYKRRSAVALAEKDQRIAELLSSSSTHLDTSNEAEVQRLKATISGLESSLAAATAELTKLRSTANERQFASATSANELAIAQRKEREAAEAARVAQSMYDGEVASHQGTRTRLEAVIRSKDDELRLMQKQLSQLARPIPSADGQQTGDWERRAKELAELVMEKQAALEAKRGETEQWKARFESAQQRIREMELVSLSTSGAGVPNHRIIPMTNDDKEHGEGLMGEFSRSQFFGTLSRKGNIGAKITTAARHIDGLSLTAGRVLRRNSVLRVCAILYIIVLQVWCFIAVSMTSVPQSSAEVPH